MLGNVVTEESRRIVFAQQVQPALVQAIKAVIPPFNRSKTPNLISLISALFGYCNHAFDQRARTLHSAPSPYADSVHV
jgi:hypothetical protein